MFPYDVFGKPARPDEIHITKSQRPRDFLFETAQHTLLKLKVKLSDFFGNDSLHFIM